MERTRGGAKYYGILLVLCVVAFAGITFMHWTGGHSLLWSPDGLALYYNFFVYEGEWLRGIFSSLLTGAPEVPLYSFAMGYGADILATMGGCLNDPFNLVSVLCPPRYAEYVFEALIFVRFFLAAVAFSWYSLGRGRGRAASLCGSLCYVLCGFVVFWGVLRHPNFLNLAILLPVILLGADRIMARKSPYLFIGGFALLLLFSLYFSYMVLIVAVVYCLLAFFLGSTERTARRFFALLGQYVGYVLLAALLAGVVAVPLFLVLTSMGRVDLERTIPTWETFLFYWEYGSNLIGGLVHTRGLVLGVVPVLGSLAFLASRKLMDRQVWRPWAVGLGLCVAGSMIPAIGSAMNGFGYVTDRWLVVLGFCAANATTLAVPCLRRFGRRQWAVFGVLAALMALWAGAYAVDAQTLLSFVGLGCFAAVVLLMVVGARASRRVAAGVLSVAVIACTVTTSILFNSPLDKDYATQFVDAKGAAVRAHAVPYDRIEGGADPAYRVDRAGVYKARNQTLLAGIKGFDFFSSFYNQAVDDARYDVGISSHWTNYIYNGVEGRFALDNLMGAKYFIVEDAAAGGDEDDEGEGRSDTPPYGYVLAQDLGTVRTRGPYLLYESALALPLAFTYDTAISASAFNELGMVQRQEALTQGCVLEDEVLAAQEGVPAPLSTEEQPYEVIEQEGVRVTDQGVEVLEPFGTMLLRVDGIAEAENYVVFDRLRFEPLSLEAQRQATGKPAVIDRETGQLATPWDELKWEAPGRTSIGLRAGGEHRNLQVATSTSSSYGGKVNWAVNMGYSDKACKKFRLRFAKPGFYRWDKLSIVSQPVGAIEENLKKLKESNKASISFATNRMDVAVAPEEGADERYTFLSIPYSAGWSATMDGQPAKILKANTGFMAVAMDGNAHELVFTYTTPGLKAGIVCTAVGAAGLVLLVAARRQRAKRQNRKEQHEQDD